MKGLSIVPACVTACQHVCNGLSAGTPDMPIFIPRFWRPDFHGSLTCDVNIASIWRERS